DHAEELLEQRTDLLGVKVRRQAGVADQITEHDRDRAPGAVGLKRTISGSVRLPPQRTPPPPPEPIGPVADGTAGPGPGERRAAGRAKPAALPILRLAA